MNTDQLVGYFLGPLGTLFLALLIIVSGYKKFWVFGWYAEDLYKRNVRLEQRLDMLLAETKEIVDGLDE